MTKETRIYNRERTVSLISTVRKIGQLTKKNETRALPYIIHTKNNLNVTFETIKFGDENTGSECCDTGLSNVFVDLTPKTREIKAKINK